MRIVTELDGIRIVGYINHGDIPDHVVIDEGSANVQVSWRAARTIENLLNAVCGTRSLVIAYEPESEGDDD